MKDMENIHIAPFKHAINKGIDVIMVAHLHCECFNKDILPTSLSANCVNYLRSKLNFNGVIMSDDMYMNGVMKYGMVDACIMGIKAGLNIHYQTKKWNQIVLYGQEISVKKMVRDLE